MTDRTPDLLATIADDESLSDEDAAKQFRAVMARRRLEREAAPAMPQPTNASRGVPENRPNSGALFANDKQGNPKRPDVTGHLQFTAPDTGKVYRLRLAGWERTAHGSGQQFTSLKADVQS